jgi:hypothetical protein
LRDRFRLLNPGETEVRVEDTTGIKVLASKVGTSTERSVKFVGPGGPLADDGIQLSFEVTDRAAPASSACSVPSAEPARPGMPSGLVVVAAAVLAFVLAVIVTLRKRRKR